MKKQLIAEPISKYGKDYKRSFIVGNTNGNSDILL